MRAATTMTSSASTSRRACASTTTRYASNTTTTTTTTTRAAADHAVSAVAHRRHNLSASRRVSPALVRRGGLNGTTTATRALDGVAESFGTFAGSKGSYWASLGLFLMTAPGLWSLVKRAPKASVKTITFEAAGPSAAAGGEPLDFHAKAIARYFTKYNYGIADLGEVITFEGTYAANRGQGIALAFYVFLGLGSTALVLSIVAPDVGNWWYAMPLASPGAYFYYMRNGTRTEQVKVKMVTSDDDSTTDIILQGDKEEIERFSKEMGYVEKGKIRVKGILEGDDEGKLPSGVDATVAQEEKAKVTANNDT